MNKNMTSLRAYYVILTRDTRFDDTRTPSPDHVRLMDAEEAIRHNWVDKAGNRIWVVEPKYENQYITFVWGFDSYDEAELFFNVMKTQEIGRKTSGNDTLPWDVEMGYRAVA